MSAVSMTSLMTHSVELADIECIIFSSERTDVFGCGEGENFVTTTPIDAIRVDFLRSCLFVDVNLDSEYVCADGRRERENRALINITQIQSLQMFDEGDAWITLKQGGDITNVSLTEAQLQNLVRRAKLTLVSTEGYRRDGLGEYRVFEAQEPTVAESPEVVAPEAVAPIMVAAPSGAQRRETAGKKKCPLCSRTEPCASKRCGLK